MSARELPIWYFTISTAQIVRRLREAGVIAHVERKYRVKLGEVEIVHLREAEMDDRSQFFQAWFNPVSEAGGAGGNRVVFRYGIIDPISFQPEGILLKASSRGMMREIRETDYVIDDVVDLDLGYETTPTFENPQLPQPQQRQQPQQPQQSQQPQQPQQSQQEGGYIINPTSGRKIKANGRLGRKILTNQV